MDSTKTSVSFSRSESQRSRHRSESPRCTPDQQAPEQQPATAETAAPDTPGSEANSRSASISTLDEGLTAEEAAAAVLLHQGQPLPCSDKEATIDTASHSDGEVASSQDSASRFARIDKDNAVPAAADETRDATASTTKARDLSKSADDGSAAGALASDSAGTDSGALSQRAGGSCGSRSPTVAPPGSFSSSIITTPATPPQEDIFYTPLASPTSPISLHTPFTPPPHLLKKLTPPKRDTDFSSSSAAPVLDDPHALPISPSTTSPSPARRRLSDERLETAAKRRLERLSQTSDSCGRHVSHVKAVRAELSSKLQLASQQTRAQIQEKQEKAEIRRQEAYKKKQDTASSLVVAAAKHLARYHDLGVPSDSAIQTPRSILTAMPRNEDILDASRAEFPSDASVETPDATGSLKQDSQDTTPKNNNNDNNSISDTKQTSQQYISISVPPSPQTPFSLPDSRTILIETPKSALATLIDADFTQTGSAPHEPHSAVVSVPGSKPHRVLTMPLSASDHLLLQQHQHLEAEQNEAKTKERAAAIIVQAFRNWQHRRVAQSICKDAPYLMEWGVDDENYGEIHAIDNQPFYVGDFAGFSTQSSCHQWMENMIQSPELLKHAELFISVFLRYTRSTHSLMAPRVFLIAFLFSHHGALIGVSKQVFLSATRLGRSVKSLLRNPTNRLLHMCLFIDYVHFYSAFGKWKIQDFDKLTRSLVDMISIGIRLYNQTASDMQRGLIDVDAGCRLLATHDVNHSMHFRHLAHLTGTDAARSMVSTQIASCQFIDHLDAVLAEYKYQTLAEVAGSVARESGEMAAYKDMEGLRHSNMRVYAFQTLINPKFLLGYSWTRSSLYDAEYYGTHRYSADAMKHRIRKEKVEQHMLRDKRRMSNVDALVTFGRNIETEKLLRAAEGNPTNTSSTSYIAIAAAATGGPQSVQSARRQRKERALEIQKTNARFIPLVVKYLYESLGIILRYKENGDSALSDSVKMDYQLVVQQLENNAFDVYQYFDHFFLVLERNAISRPDRHRLLANVKRKLYRGLDESRFSYDGLLHLVDLMELLTIDMINISLAQHREEVAKMGLMVELPAFVEDLRTGKVRLPVLNRWANEIAVAKYEQGGEQQQLAEGALGRHEKADALWARFCKFMTAFTLRPSNSQLDLTDMPELFTSARRLVVDYKLELKDIAVSSAILNSVVYVLGARGAQYVEMGQLKKAVYEAVRSDGDAISNVNRYVAKICNAVSQGLMGGPRGAELCAVFGDSCILVPEYTTSNVDLEAKERRRAVKQAYRSKMNQLKQLGQLDKLGRLGQLDSDSDSDDEEGQDVYWSRGGGGSDGRYGAVEYTPGLEAKLHIVKNPRAWLVARVQSAVRDPAADLMAAAAFANLERNLQLRPGQERKFLRLFEVESEEAVGKVQNLWTVVMKTYAPVLEAFYRDPRPWRLGQAQMAKGIV